MNSIHRFFGDFLSLYKFAGFISAGMFAVQYSVYRWMLPRKKMYKITLKGVHFYFPSIKDFGDFAGIFFNEYYYLPRSERSISAIDCGSNVGISLVYIKIQCPNARVVCFEPNPAARVFLKRTIAANGWEKEVTIQPYALGKTKGTANFFVDRNIDTSSGASLTHFLEGYNQPTVVLPVQVEQLSTFIEAPVDFLKIDIEGAEFEVLEELILNNKLKQVASIQLEHHYHQGFLERPLSDMLKLLESAGFKTAVQATLRPSVLIGRTNMTAYMVYAWRA